MTAIAGTTFVLEPRYSVQNCIGRGSGGVVCSATSVSGVDGSKVTVAIKKISDVLEDSTKRTLREVRLLQDTDQCCPGESHLQQALASEHPPRWLPCEVVAAHSNIHVLFWLSPHKSDPSVVARQMLPQLESTASTTDVGYRLM